MSTNIKPASRPKLLREKAITFLDGIDLKKYPLVILGIRGYYKNTMGIESKNDKGIYDDAIFVISDKVFVSFNANTDPSTIRKGTGLGSNKGMANLKEGIYYAHKLGLHRGKYEALIQIGGEVVVKRDGIVKDYEDKGYFGINIHKGSLTNTSSAGCQTIYPLQWIEFISLVKSEMKRVYGKAFSTKIVPYVLVENKGQI